MPTNSLKISPAFKILTREAFPESAWSRLDAAFFFALEHGGGEEIDFLREPGASFNPRPGRVTHILLKDSGVQSAETIIAALISCASPGIFYEDKNPLPFEPHIVSLVKHAQASQKLELIPQLPTETPSLDIALALWLDRLRHLHLSPNLKNLPKLEILDRTAYFVAIAEKQNSPLTSLLRHSQARIGKLFA